MPSPAADRSLMRSGFVLLLLGLLTGLAAPMFTNPRMGLAAHLEGVLNGILLIVLGLAWGHLQAAPRSAVIRRLFLYAAFANWLATSLAAALGTSRLTPIAGAGFTAASWAEALVMTLQVSLALAIILACGLTVSALGKPAR